MIPVRERAHGQWPAILPVLGVAAEFLRNHHGPCPICKAGRDRFRFDDKDGSGSWYCNQCGAGNGVDLVMKVNGWEFLPTAREIEQVLGDMPEAKPKPAKPGRTDEDRRASLQRAWDEGRPITLESAAGAYLHRRTGLQVFPLALRAHGRLFCNEGPEVAPTRRPAMLARISAVDGKPVNIHRTYLTYEGEKAQIDSPRRVMPGTIPDGSAVRLAKHGDTLGIAEGLETALSATVLFGTPCWAAISGVMLENWSPPTGVKTVIVYADRDENYYGQQRAINLARKLIAMGLNASVEMPPIHGQDWNDVLVASFAGGADVAACGGEH